MTRQDRLGLSLVVEPGDVRLRNLLLTFEPAEILAAILGRHRLVDTRIPEAWIERGRDLDRTAEVAAARAKAAGLRWVTPGDKEWPTALSDLDHVEPVQGVTGAPVGLWLRGVGHLGEMCEQSVAIVGARECTTYGAECASDLAADCADAGWTVISGAAYGIDGCAHRGAFLMNALTAGVLACGADLDYPKSHAALIARIAEGGVVVSEQAPGEKPLKNRFLSRNRLIAAMTQGTVVIEARERSGSLNTLNWADQLGRTTMALPGPVTSGQSAGVHAAIRAGKAVVVTTGREIVAEMSGLGASTEEQPSLPLTEFDRLPPAARSTLDGLEWSTPRAVAEIAASVRLSTREVRAALDLLERRDLVIRAGAEWMLARRADVG
ncbi:DNA-processing protein DprA [Aeromicrobium ginsengisoli]|uniref:DNA-processing protein DprA n=1 Tax=Aeromicrobium ginsengisoli TaxID=363867 RepID=A0A5M4FFR3_9ACTN|nr:DNA-processing protein DprA [Aeromicrobium ginsengisoli]KAA1398059.1 DNA-processing protein DprA [Aeromicrobium ginsengisoli]